MFKFAIDMEKELTCQLEFLEKNAGLELAEVLRLILKSQKEFVEILKSAAAINIDLEGYGRLDLQMKKLSGEDNTLIQVLQNQNKETEPHKTLCGLWMAQTLIEKSAQYYAQAANNSPHPALKLFMNSLGQIKNIQKGRLNACVRMAYNDVWEKIGFAPFVLGKD